MDILLLHIFLSFAHYCCLQRLLRHLWGPPLICLFFFLWLHLTITVLSSGVAFLPYYVAALHQLAAHTQNSQIPSHVLTTAIHLPGSALCCTLRFLKCF